MPRVSKPINSRARIQIPICFPESHKHLLSTYCVPGPTPGAVRCQIHCSSQLRYTSAKNGHPPSCCKTRRKKVTHQGVEKLENNWKLEKLAKPCELFWRTHEDLPNTESAGPRRDDCQCDEGEGSPRCLRTIHSLPSPADELIISK